MPMTRRTRRLSSRSRAETSFSRLQVDSAGCLALYGPCQGWGASQCRAKASEFVHVGTLVVGCESFSFLHFMLKIQRDVLSSETAQKKVLLSPQWGLF